MAAIVIIDDRVQPLGQLPPVPRITRRPAVQGLGVHPALDAREVPGLVT
jgi:hypothetical protein